MHNAILWHFRLTTSTMETQQCLLSVLLSNMSLPTMSKYRGLNNNAFTINLRHRQKKNVVHERLHVQCPMVHCDKRILLIAFRRTIGLNRS